MDNKYLELLENYITEFLIKDRDEIEEKVYQH